MDIIKESFFKVIKDSIGLNPQDSIIPVKRGYLVSIEMIGEKIVYLVFNKSFLRIMCKYFLSDENPTEPALEDMAKELSNLTVGHAKVIAQQKNKTFNISTPNFLGIKNITDYDEGIHFRLQSKGHCSIFMRNYKA